MVAVLWGVHPGALPSPSQDVHDIFHAYKDRPVVARNSAPHSGAVAWVRGMVERIDEPMQKLRTMSKVRPRGVGSMTP
jgi:hypothetical protein